MLVRSQPSVGFVLCLGVSNNQIFGKSLEGRQLECWKFLAVLKLWQEQVSKANVSSEKITTVSKGTTPGIKLSAPT